MKTLLTYKITFATLLLAGIFFSPSVKAQQKFEKAAFYTVMDNGDLTAIDNQIAIVKESSSANKAGYEGALLMRKAGKVSGPKKKLGFFKEGRIKLETAILADPDNTEYRFLRLAIEEHAPKIVKYHNDLEQDKAAIKTNFKSLPESVKHAIIDYCKNSKVLHAEEL